mgnify:FL=1
MNQQAKGHVNSLQWFLRLFPMEERSNARIYSSRRSCVDQAKVLRLPFTSVSGAIFKLCCSLVEFASRTTVVSLQ